LSNGNHKDVEASKDDSIAEQQQDSKTGDNDEAHATESNGTATPKRGRKRQASASAPKNTTAKKAKLTNKSSSTASNSDEPIVYQAGAPPSVEIGRPSTSGEFMCEWECCGAMFSSSSAILFHSTRVHLRSASDETNDVELMMCRWPYCDATPRSKWSMATHLQDHHCTEAHLQAALRKRREMGHHNYMDYIRQQLEKVKEATHHPGYSKFAAIEAIRRHAFTYMSKDITEDNEGPVTRSLRLTSSLILRNLAKHSAEGRRKLQKYEPRLIWLAGSRMESSSALAQTLAELASHSTQMNAGSSQQSTTSRSHLNSQCTAD